MDFAQPNKGTSDKPITLLFVVHFKKLDSGWR